jgi:hypothetical protein
MRAVLSIAFGKNTPDRCQAGWEALASYGPNFTGTHLFFEHVSYVRSRKTIIEGLPAAA